MKKINLFIILIIIILTSSCEECEDCKNISFPVIADSSFIISENSSQGDTVGTISAESDGLALTYRIIGGNYGELFAIDSVNGMIIINNETIDYETQSIYELGIEVENEENIISNSSVIIEIIDIKEYPQLDLIAYYMGEGNSQDSSSSELHLSGISDFTVDRDNLNNAAFSFNGSEGYSLLNQELTNQSTSQTISLWFKTNSLNNVEYGGLIFGIIRSGIAGTGSRFILSMQDGLIKASYGDEYGDDLSWGENLFTQASYNDNMWHHLVFVSKGDNKSSLLIIDGAEVGSKVFIKSNNNNQTNLDIKLGGDKPENYFTGAIDDILLYNRALSLEEILELYKEG